MQPYFFPYVGYFQAIAAVDRYVLYSNLNYIVDGWIHRNRILGAGGEVFYILVDVVKKSSYKRIREIKLDNSRGWRRKVLKSISMNYAKRPFFRAVYPVVESVIDSNAQYLHELNELGIRAICRFLDLATEIVDDDDRFPALEEKLAKVDSDDYSGFPYLGGRRPTRKVLRVIDVCRCEGAGTFVNAMGGQELYDKSEFASYGIELRFVRTGNVVYKQGSGSFVPNLSIIDVLMNCGRDGTRALLDEYELT
jgi:hypothetical protein